MRPDTKKLKELLISAPGISGVEHARGQVSHDETELLPDVLKFTYRHTGFFAQTQRDGRVLVERQNSSCDNVVGEPLPFTVTDFVERLVELLDAVVNLIVVVSEIGEAIVADNEYSDQALLETAFHQRCGGQIEFTQVSESHYALHCGSCNLRIVYPAKIQTFGQLRYHFRQFNR